MRDYDFKLEPLNSGKMDRKNKESTLNEVRILCSVESEYVVGYNDAFLSKNGKELCIGMHNSLSLSGFPSPN